MESDFAVEASFGNAANVAPKGSGRHFGVADDAQAGHVQLDVVVHEVDVTKKVVVLTARNQAEAGMSVSVTDHVSTGGDEVARVGNYVGARPGATLQ